MPFDPNILGLAFQPGSDQNQGGQGAPPLQEAIKLLNLRLPSVVGARSPISPQLLQASGGQGQTQNQVLQLLQRLGLMGGPSAPDSPRITDPFGQPPSMTDQKMGPGGPPPPPRVTPGDGPGTGAFPPSPMPPRERQETRLPPRLEPRR